MIKLVAFDWNGTIFSDTLACCEGVNKVLNSLKLKPITVTFFREHFDVPLTNTYMRFGISKTQLKNQGAEIVKTFHTYYEKRADKIRTRAYANYLISWLTKNNIRSIIFSNHIDEPIRTQRKRL